MNLTNVRLILAREVRDQLRDRRTMFMIFVLPVLLYPLLGLSMSQIMQFRSERPTTVLVIGGQDLDKPPRLFDGESFTPQLFTDPDHGPELLAPRFVAMDADEARRLVERGEADAALIFHADFSQRLNAYRESIRRPKIKPHSASPLPQAGEGPGAKEGTVDAGSNVKSPVEVIDAPQIPRPQIIYTTANKRSPVAFDRLSSVLAHWNEEVVKTALEAGGVPPSAIRPFEVETADIAERSGQRGAALWSGLLPMLMVIWAMTGAFYPAIDLCAGEKERGTLETLLSSPAQRSEIVLGKLLTIMAFSMVTAVLNLVSLGITGELMFGQLAHFGRPSPWAILWLGLALPAVAALFSALCLALAAFARSSKEGQYYLMPLLLITLPLTILPMTPGAELTLGMSLVPLTGLVLLLKSLLEGAYLPALQYLPVVLAVTLAACWIAVRWAVDQFNSESVLFRESERFDIGLWFRHLLRDRGPTPTVGGAVFCGVLILMIRFFLSPMLAGGSDFAVNQTITLLVIVLTPALLMTILLTTSPRQTLLLRAPRWSALPAAAVLAVAVHPLIITLGTLVEQLYPMADEIRKQMAEPVARINALPMWEALLVLAVMPALCEELAFRGFILSGLRHSGHRWRAIVLSAVFFGITHAMLQQSILACLVGIVLGYVAVQSGSILPGMVFHLLHNAMLLSSKLLTIELFERWPALSLLVQMDEKGERTYPWYTVALGVAAAAAILAWFARMPCEKTAEEQLQDAIDHAPEEPAECLAQ